MKISKELFISSIEALQKQYEHDQKCSEAFKIILPHDFITSYDNHFTNNKLLELLQVLTNDNHQHSWIEYYCFELDFGKKWKKGDVTEKDGMDIPLATIEDLWNLLSKNYETK